MPSPAITARLGAAMNAELAGGGDDDAVTEAVETDENEGGAATEPADVVTEATEATPEQVEAKARAARVALFEEKLKGAQEKRQAQKLAERAKADRKAAQADREAAKAERAKYDGLKDGTFRQTLETLGRDPLKTWEEMNREAIEASTPEAQAKREEAARQKALDDRLTPMQEELKQLRAEREQFLADQEQHRITTNFQRELANPVFEDLRIRHSDEALFDHAQYFIKHPEIIHTAAKTHGILTDHAKGFTMNELLRVMAAVQAAEDSEVQARRSARRPAEPQSAPPTVNGTAPRRNAATAIGNDLASQRAAAKPEVSALSPRERLRQRVGSEIRKGGG